MSAQHTQGEWVYREELGGVYAMTSEGPQDGKARALIADTSDGQTWNGAPLPIDEREANGRLICAAPGLLAALKRMTDDFEGLARHTKITLGGFYKESVNESRAAIAKAKGQP